MRKSYRTLTVTRQQEDNYGKATLLIKILVKLRSTQDTVRKSHRTLTVTSQQEDNYGKATLLIKILVKLGST